MQPGPPDVGASVAHRSRSAFPARALMREVANRRRAVLLMGPPGSGKSDLGVRLAETLALEIVSVDSALGYRGMDIGTAKPTAAMRLRVAHHLIDIPDPAENYSARDFTRDAAEGSQDSSP